MSEPKLSARPAGKGDIEAINDLYNHYVRETHVTFDIDPITLEARREWFSHYALTGRHRLFVAISNDAVLGYASSNRFRPKIGYETSVETSVYLAADAIGHGAGSTLYTELFRALDGQDVHRAYAGVALPNPASIALHERFGFKKVAHFTEQGRKFGRYWDVVWFEKTLGNDVRA